MTILFPVSAFRLVPVLREFPVNISDNSDADNEIGFVFNHNFSSVTPAYHAFSPLTLASYPGGATHTPSPHTTDKRHDRPTTELRVAGLTWHGPTKQDVVTVVYRRDLLPATVRLNLATLADLARVCSITAIGRLATFAAVRFSSPLRGQRLLLLIGGLTVGSVRQLSPLIRVVQTFLSSSVSVSVASSVRCDRSINSFG